tara:strand:+ start:185 stop:463 length:279 start_codon:yes stop_codon:yes gene_type:complete
MFKACRLHFIFIVPLVIAFFVGGALGQVIVDARAPMRCLKITKTMHGVGVGEQVYCARNWQRTNVYGPTIGIWLEERELKFHPPEADEYTDQ